MGKLKICAFALLLLLLLSCVVPCQGQDSFPAGELKFDPNICAATRPGKSKVTYLLLWAGWIRALTTGTCPAFTEKWLKGHPDALVTPISQEGLTVRGAPSAPTVYIWIEDGRESLNVALIQNGIFPGYVMMDMVETAQVVMDSLNTPGLAASRKQIERERAETPPADRPKRLVTDPDYAERRKKVIAAENEARERKKGIWSDEYKELRENEGFDDGVGAVLERQ